MQTFTIRKYQKKDMEAAYLPLIKLGIKDYEIARIKFNQKNAHVVKRLIKKYDIHVAAIQVKPKQVFEQVEEIVAFCQITGCKNVVISMLPFECILGSEDKFYGFLERLDGQYDLYAAQGIELAYHHHNWEYVSLSNKKTRMDELIERTERIKFVHDTYWTTKSGFSAEQQIKRFGNRLLGIHLRDLTLYQKGLNVLSRDAAVGDGVIDFVSVLSSAVKVGCRYFVIEQKTNQPYEELVKAYECCLRIKEHIREGVE